MVEQHAGGGAHPELLRTLATCRRANVGGVVFGAKYVVFRPGWVEVG